VLAFVSLSRLAAGDASWNDVLALASSLVGGLAPGATIAWYTVDEASGYVVQRHAAGPAATQVTGTTLRIGDGVSGWVVANRQVIVKQHRPETDAVRSAGTRACYEHDVLVSLRAAMTGDYSVPRPLLVDKPLGAVVIEKACGRALDEWIREGKRSDTGARALVPLVARAGTWLRLMQQHTRSAEDPRPLMQRVVERAHTDLEAISKTDWLIRMKLASDAIRSASAIRR
jgi:hypothetical protein